ncbi:MAG: immunity 22 family protein [Bacteroidales bacterium]|jgi:hypothetical protein|nr:immunity 22 family protein [Bacteroidales bacterium]
MNKIYLWIGLFNKTEEEYWEYFYSKNGIPQFYRDVGFDWLDEDFIGYYLNKDSNELKTVIENTPESGLYDVMLEACVNKGIKQANAMFYYTGDDIKNIDENKIYNGLKYIGMFDWE